MNKFAGFYRDACSGCMGTAAAIFMASRFQSQGGQESLRYPPARYSSPIKPVHPRAEYGAESYWGKSADSPTGNSGFLLLSLC